MLTLTLGVGSVLARHNAYTPQYIGVVDVEPDTLGYEDYIIEDSVLVEEVAVADEDINPSAFNLLDEIEAFTECGIERYEALSTGVLSDMYENETLNPCGVYVLALRKLQNAVTDADKEIGMAYLTDSAFSGYTKAMVLLGTLLIAADDATADMIELGGDLLIKAAQAGDEEAMEIITEVVNKAGLE